MTPPPSPTRVYEACLVELGKTLRTAQFYPLEHPAFRRSLDRSYLFVSRLLHRVHPLVFTITKNEILVDETPVRGHGEVLAFLARELFRRRVKQLHIDEGLSVDELAAFFRLLALEPREVAAAGGPEVVLAKHGARHLWANEMRFEATQLLDEEQPELAEVDQEATQESVAELLATEADTHDQLRRLLDRLQNAEAAEARQLAPEVLSEVRRAIETGDLIPALLTFNLLGKLVEHRDGTAVGKIARSLLEAIAVPEVIIAQVHRLGEAVESTWRIYARPLWLLGDRVVPFLLAELTRSEARRARLRLLEAIHGFGPRALGPVLKLLQDRRWYVLRNALVLVGDLGVGDERLTPAVLPFFRHKHPQVRRAAREAARKLGGQQAWEALLGVVHKGDEADRRHAVGQLGYFPAEQALPVLLKLIDEAPVAVAEEALRTLAELSPPDLVPYLEGLMERKGGLFGRRRQRALRRVAAEQLCLRLPETWPILERYAKDEDAEVRKWVLRGYRWLQLRRRRARGEREAAKIEGEV